MTTQTSQTATQAWWLSEFTILTNLPLGGHYRSFEFSDAPELQAICEEMGEDIEIAMAMEFPVVFVADMSRREITSHRDFTAQDVGRSFGKFEDIEEFSAERLIIRRAQMPEADSIKMFGRFPTDTLAINWSGMQLFSHPVPTTGAPGAIGKKMWSAPRVPEASFLPTSEIVNLINRHGNAPRPYPKMEYPVLGEKLFETPGSTGPIKYYVLDKWLKSKGLVSLRDKDSGLTHLMSKEAVQSGTKATFKEPTNKIV